MELDRKSLAREAANSLAQEMGEPNLPSEVETVLKQGAGKDVRLDASTLISLATLVVSVAQLAVAIYLGLTGNGRRTRGAIVDELRDRLKAQTDASPEKQEKIIHHVVNALFEQER